MSNFPPGYDPLADKIEIVAYNFEWPKQFEAEKAALLKALDTFPGLMLEHHGSTAVPGLSAKPIIDIMVAVENRGYWPRLIGSIQSLGYVYWLENSQKDEMFFVKGMPPYGKKRTHHLHVYDFQGSQWKKQMIFRDYLRSLPEEARRYEALKRELAEKFPFNREAYTGGKTTYIQEVLKKAGNA